MRISAYGITVNRYFIVLLGIWLGTISIVRIFKPTWIKIVPTSIACFVLLSSFGFWGVNFISEKSQINRLENIMTKMKLLKNGKLTQEFHYNNTDSLITSNPKITLSIKDENEINSIIRYLDTYHGFDNIYPWFTQNVDSIIQTTKEDEFFSDKKLIKNVMGITYRYKKSVKDNYFSVKEMTIEKISPYDYRTSSDYNYNGKTFTIQNISFYCSIDKKNQLFIVKKNKHEFISYSITELIQKLQKKYKGHQYNIPQQEMTIVIEKDNYCFKINFEHISLYDDKITNAKYFILIKMPSSEPSIDSTVIQ